MLNFLKSKIFSCLQEFGEFLLNCSVSLDQFASTTFRYSNSRFRRKPHFLLTHPLSSSLSFQPFSFSKWFDIYFLSFFHFVIFLFFSLNSLLRSFSDLCSFKCFIIFLYVFALISIDPTTLSILLLSTAILFFPLMHSLFSATFIFYLSLLLVFKYFPRYI